MHPLLIFLGIAIAAPIVGLGGSYILGVTKQGIFGPGKLRRGTQQIDKHPMEEGMAIFVVLVIVGHIIGFAILA